MTDIDNLLANFEFLKGLTRKYGVEQAADLVRVADRLVGDQVFPNRREAVEAIEAWALTRSLQR